MAVFGIATGAHLEKAGMSTGNTAGLKQNSILNSSIYSECFRLFCKQLRCRVMLIYLILQVK